jgi:hypothetical protein
MEPQSLSGELRRRLTLPSDLSTAVSLPESASRLTKSLGSDTLLVFPIGPGTQVSAGLSRSFGAIDGVSPLESQPS